MLSIEAETTPLSALPLSRGRVLRFGLYKQDPIDIRIKLSDI